LNPHYTDSIYDHEMTYSSQFNKTKNLDIRTSFYNIELEFQLLEPSRFPRRTRRAFLQGSDSLCGSFIYPYLHTRITTINADTNGKKNDTPNQPAPLAGLEGACTGKVIVAGCSSSAGSVFKGKELVSSFMTGKCNVSHKANK